jgi:pyruvate dehydrogenase E1 component alpha subunit
MISRTLSQAFNRNTVQLGRYFAGKTLTIELPENDLYLIEKGQLLTKTTTNKDEILNYIKEMTIMRRMEIVSDTLYKDKKIHGFCHLYDGQEATALGIEAALTFDDCLITAYRDHCQAYLRGISLFEIFAEMLGKQGGSSRGKGGSMHYYKKANNYYGGNGIVGAQVPVGTGLAFAQKYTKSKNISIAMYGDGAASQG